VQGHWSFGVVLGSERMMRERGSAATSKPRPATNTPDLILIGCLQPQIGSKQDLQRELNLPRVRGRQGNDPAEGLVVLPAKTIGLGDAKFA